MLQAGGEVDWWAGGGTTVSLAVPPPGILRTSSSHSSSSNQPEPEPEPERAKPAPPTYSARSDTVLEICLEGEDISFIDDDLEVPEEHRSEAVGNVGSDDGLDDSASEDGADDDDKDDGGGEKDGCGGGGEIVIKLNNSSSPLLTCRAVHSVQVAPTPEEHQDNYDELSETSFQLGYDVSVRAPMSYEESSSESGSVETLACKPGPGRGRGRRNLLVRQSRLQAESELNLQPGLQSDQARKRQSIATSHRSQES